MTPKKLRRQIGLLLSELRGIGSPLTWYRWSWYAYATCLRLLSFVKNPARRADATFAQMGYRQGAFSEAEMRPLLASIERATVKGLQENDFLPGYVSSDVQRYVGQINESHRHILMGQDQLEALQPLLKTLAPKIEECIGTPWRVVNVRCWKTLASAPMVGANGPLHLDGFPPHILKTMIYLTPPGMETGTTELVFEDGSTHAASGPAGTWLIFRNSKLLHRGVTSKSCERGIVEITLAPALRHDQRPVCAGENALYPKFPWTSAGRAR